MIHKALFITLLLFSYVLSSSAVPITRSLSPTSEKSSIQTSLEEGTPESRNSESEMFDLAQEFMTVEGRMDLESNDYPGTGANRNHDPKTPGRG
ncbi:hypothetical protein HN51_009089 [Arachis hypogaea]|uniref:Uncharacterized protein LOC107490812 isoform X2 n=1 Tax=Arachis duranensis TaxID=130453 RepID=A0A9C6WTX6_ARADU|nr:uncharacterized protein LOC107490812 isoform X2 [Arachis duranensis]QHO43523.1 uncharacterized protein DS421_5g163460 [Arachis hypogaea]